MGPAQAEGGRDQAERMLDPGIMLNNGGTSWPCHGLPPWPVALMASLARTPCLGCRVPPDSHTRASSLYCLPSSPPANCCSSLRPFVTLFLQEAPPACLPACCLPCLPAPGSLPFRNVCGYLWPGICVHACFLATCHPEPCGVTSCSASTGHGRWSVVGCTGHFSSWAGLLFGGRWVRADPGPPAREVGR